MIEETFDQNGYTVNIIRDEMPFNPRKEFDSLGTMVCWHSRYNLGDVDGSKEYNSPSELVSYLQRERCIALPLFLYDHSGITMSTQPFSCPWDSGQVGWIFVEREKVYKEYSAKRITKTIREKVVRILQQEVKTYDDYLTGEVYGYEVLKGGETVDSCWGFYGRDHEKSGLMEAVLETVGEEVTA
jgi:hypothetical protein